MLETKFIKENKEKWEEFEKLFETGKEKKQERKTKSASKLANLFIEITNDLSYAQTFYPKRSVKFYLNSLAQQVFQSLYKRKKTEKNYLFQFWTEELPLLFYEARKDLLFSLTFFIIAVLIGVVSTANSPDFAEQILGGSYMEMTRENIANNDPMAVYKQQNEVDMFLGITINNARVSLLTFLYGIFYGIGTIYILLQNGIMLGAFQYYFFQEGLFMTSFLTIWIHGTLEISEIIIAGAAGLTMGRGLIFPGTFSRLQAFQVSALRGIKILLGVLPMVIVAGFLEGFVTRHTEAPVILKAGIIILSLFFVLTYVVWYPWKVAKSRDNNTIKDFEPSPPIYQKLEYYKTRTMGAVFMDTFEFYRIHFKDLAYTSLILLSPLFVLQIFFLLADFSIPTIDFTMNPEASYAFINQVLGLHLANIPHLLASLLAWTMEFCIVFYFLSTGILKKTTKVNFVWKDFIAFVRNQGLKILIVVTVFKALLAISWWIFGLLVFFLPVIVFYIFSISHEKLNFKTAWKNAFNKVLSNYFPVLLLQVFLFLSCMVGYFIINIPLDMIYNLQSFEGSTLEIQSIEALYTVVNMLIVALFTPIFLLGMGFEYLSIVEKQAGIGIKERISKIGLKSRVYEKSID